jgi:dipeptidase E
MIYLGGGGSEEDEAAVFAAAFQPGARIVVWPFAQPSHRWQGTLSWIQSSISHLGSFPPASLGTQDDFGLNTADVVVIPGGNTFLLLHHMQQHALLHPLRSFVAKGGKVYGGSAGAVLLGAGIAIIDAMDTNDVGLRDTSALDLLSGCVVYPHYERRWMSHCLDWSTRACVLGVPERAGLRVDLHGRAVNLGPEDVVVFEGGLSEVWPAGRERMLRPLHLRDS